MATENNNINKELYSRPAILDKILNEFGQEPISFLELLGDGTGAEFYNTWLNIDYLVLVERDKKKCKDYDMERLDLSSHRKFLFHTDLIEYFKFHGIHSYPFEVVNLDFCTFLFDNGTDDCTMGVINKMFELEILKDGSLVFFTFMITGLGVNFSKNEVIKNRNDMFGAISGVADKNSWDVEEMHYYTYKSSKPTTMANLGIRVKKKTSITGE